MIKCELLAGKYVVAVSGGVDSMVLLDILRRQPQLEIIVAHFDHGIREESADDAAFVQALAQSYGLPFFLGRQQLGADASEEIARNVRYYFLRQVCAEQQATLVTAHHQDDLLETGLINLHRGTGWRGLCSLRDAADVRRPLLGSTKEQIVAYATARRLEWVQDATNTYSRYLRNRIRQQLVPRLGNARAELLQRITAQVTLRAQIEEALQQAVQFEHVAQGVALPRHELIMMPTGVFQEVLRYASVYVTGKSMTRHMLVRARWFACTAGSRKTLQLGQGLEMHSTRRTVVVRVK